MSKLRITFGIERLNASNALESGGFPQGSNELETTSAIRSGGAVQLVGTTEELLAAGDVTDEAVAVLQNLDDTAVIEIGRLVAGTFYPLVKLSPSDPPAYLGRLSGLADTYVKSSIADGELLVMLHKIVSA